MNNIINYNAKAGILLEIENDGFLSQGNPILVSSVIMPFSATDFDLQTVV
jgi:hypothetical protein